jgi:hypothetical protein
MNRALTNGCLLAILILGVIVIFVAVVSAIVKFVFLLALVVVVLAIGYVLGKSSRGDE